MPTFSEWQWSDAHNSYYMYEFGDDGVIVRTHWSAPSVSHLLEVEDQEAPSTTSDPAQPLWNSYTAEFASSSGTGKLASNTLAPDTLPNLDDRSGRAIKTANLSDNAEKLNHHYYVRADDSHQFFVPGRVFAMLWTEPTVGTGTPTRRPSVDSFVTLDYEQTVYAEIRRFVVVQNKGTYSQCMPIQTYGGMDATIPGTQARDHGIIYTGDKTPQLSRTENLNIRPIHVLPKEAEGLAPESRIDYGKSYAVEHNVKVADIGTVDEAHLDRLQRYSKAAFSK